MSGGCEYPMMNPSDYRYLPCGKPATATIRGHAYCARHDPHRAAEIEDRIRLTADAVLKAADAYVRKDMDDTWLEEHSCWLTDGQLAIARAVLAHRKALAEQAKEASRG